MRILDLFCGAGGVSMGYARAGFEVVGVDIRPQPRYPFEFHQADALDFPLDGFDAIHASPPCQAFTPMRRLGTMGDHPDLLTPMRSRLATVSTPWVIENVPGAPGPFDLRLCGTMFGLRVLRHRYFQFNWPGPLAPASCHHTADFVTVVGTGAAVHSRANSRGGLHRRPAGVADARDAMGISWMTRKELAQAIPPAYTEWIGLALAAHLEGEAVSLAEAVARG